MIRPAPTLADPVYLFVIINGDRNKPDQVIVGFLPQIMRLGQSLHHKAS